MKRRISIRSVAGAVGLAVALWVYATLNARVTALVEFPVVILYPYDRAAEGKLPSAVQVRVRVTGWELLNLQYLGAKPGCVLDFSTYNGQQAKLPVTKNDILRSLHPSVSLEKITEVTPESFEIATSPVVEKKVPVQPDVRIIPRDGFGLVGAATARPDSIVIRGSAGLLQNITSWKSEPAVVRDVAREFTLSLPLRDSLQNKVVIPRQPVSISGNVQLIAEQTIHDIPVEIPNLPAGETRRVAPALVSVTVRGGVGAMQSLTSESLRVVVDYQQLKSDSAGIVIPRVILPQLLELRRIEPRYVQHLQTSR